MVPEPNAPKLNIPAGTSGFAGSCLFERQHCALTWVAKIPPLVFDPAIEKIEHKGCNHGAEENSGTEMNGASRGLCARMAQSRSFLPPHQRPEPMRGSFLEDASRYRIAPGQQRASYLRSNTPLLRREVHQLGLQTCSKTTSAMNYRTPVSSNASSPLPIPLTLQQRRLQRRKK